MEQEFYEKLASFYHLIFENWDQSMRQQGAVIAKMLSSSNMPGPILDCACGIGTQSLALATLGYEVDGIDLSEAEIERAKKEATLRNLSVNFRVDDMRQLKTAPLQHYGAVIAMDNSLPHLGSDNEVVDALTAMKNRLKKGGVLLLSVRDYSKLMVERPTFTPPAFFQDGKYQRIIHQVWDWQDNRQYLVHLYITVQTESGWKSHHFVGRYRAITADEIGAVAKKTGFVDVKVMQPSETGYYQMIVRGIIP